MTAVASCHDDMHAVLFEDMHAVLVFLGVRQCAVGCRSTQQMLRIVRCLTTILNLTKGLHQQATRATCQRATMRSYHPTVILQVWCSAPQLVHLKFHDQHARSESAAAGTRYCLDCLHAPL